MLMICSPAFADQISILAENDTTYSTDQFFTHGTRIQYTDDSGWGYTIGQNMYTPRDKKTETLIPDDRPYAGYLYGSIFNTIYFNNGNDLYIEGQLGIVGPHSYAEETQTWVHKSIGNDVPAGWDNQIPDSVTCLLIGRYTTHIMEGKYFAIDPYVATYLGNLADSINGGINLYAGYNLPKDRNNNRVIPFKAINESVWNPYSYLYIGIEPKLMFYNMLLEDDRFSIHPELFVYDRNAGLVIGCKYFELAFTLCFRSKEFEEQPKPEKYASAKISVGW